MSSSNLFQAIQFDYRIIKHILEKAGYFEDWSLQGFGMLRLYLSKEVRLHIWDDRYAVPGVSLMHDHPWDFESYVVAGRIRNVRFTTDKPNLEHGYTMEPQNFLCSTIKCGPGGGIRSEPVNAKLFRNNTEIYEAGSLYSQAANEVHVSLPAQGTVTVVERTFRPDTEHARVFWNVGESWVSAEPRPATRKEIHDIVSNSLARWFTK